MQSDLKQSLRKARKKLSCEWIAPTNTRASPLDRQNNF